MPNPDKRTWHVLTITWWSHVWASPMASQWLETDADALGRLALLVDGFYRQPGSAGLLAEIRLQESRFGLSPIDRSRLQWELHRASDATPKQAPRPVKRDHDPRIVLMPTAKGAK